MRFCKKCKTDRPKEHWRKTRSSINGRMYYRFVCNKCLVKILNTLRRGRPKYQAKKAVRNKRAWIRLKNDPVRYKKYLENKNHSHVQQ